MPNKEMQELKKEWRLVLGIGVALISVLWVIFAVDSIFFRSYAFALN